MTLSKILIVKASFSFIVKHFVRMKRIIIKKKNNFEKPSSKIITT